MTRNSNALEDWQELEARGHDLLRHLAQQIVTAWAFVTGLRVTTRAERDRMAGVVKTYHRQAQQAEAGKRETQRLLVLLSEPLKDWDLADYPGPGYIRRADAALHLMPEDARHLANVLEAYELVRTEVANIRMGQKVDDKARRRGWDDQPLTRDDLATNSIRIPRRLP